MTEIMTKYSANTALLKKIEKDVENRLKSCEQARKKIADAVQKKKSGS